ncbi:MFS transporter [Dyella jiangningensis]|uniref:MFS transporter n=1 Tax=Dyella jiangningensis TaxID=1379159 RepID=A0A328P224_9GAMM|nr:MFS transporter [Dyella jiangningensis]RAO75341.1 MFS transporter [Dyella jiangningensis]
MQYLPRRHVDVVPREVSVELTTPLTLLFAFAVGVIIINLTAAQPLAGPVARAMRLPPAWTGLVAMLPQLGYTVGMWFLVPLADLFENRRLTVLTLAACAVALALAAVASQAWWLLLALCIAGATSCAIQILVPLAAAMAHPERRGSAVGNVMSGVMLGILLSRPLASLIEGTWGWRACYGLLGAADALLAAMLWFALPRRRPPGHAPYWALMASMWGLWRDEPVLRRYAISSAIMMAAFSAFWTAVALRLVQAPFALDSHGIAWFALAGVAGTIVAPLAGKAGDRGYSAVGMSIAHAVVVAGVLVAGMAGGGWLGFDMAAHPRVALGLLVLAAIVIDAGAIGDQTLGRRAVNMLDPAARSRLNGLFVGVFFIGGGAGAVAAGSAWAVAGWSGVCVLCVAFCVLAFAGDSLAKRKALSAV